MKKRISILFAIFAVVFCLAASATFFPDIIVTSPDGIWTDTRAYTNLSTALAAIGANERDVYIVREETVTTLVIPANIRLHFLKTGAIANSNTLTLNTRNIYANHQIFTGTGAVNFTPGSEVRTRWFEDFETAITQTANDIVTLTVDTTDTLLNSAAVGNNVLLRWNASNLITIAAGQTLSNIGDISAPDIRLFVVSGAITLKTSSPLIAVRACWLGASLATLDIADNAAVAAGKQLIITPGNWVIDDHITLTSNVKVLQNTDLQIATTKILTINGSFDTGRYPVFSYTGTGAVRFATGACREYYPEWFGGTWDGTADDAAPIAACWASITSGVMKLPPTFKTSGSLTLKASCGIVGDGIGITSVNYSGSDIWLKVPASIPTSNFTWQGMVVTCSGAALGILQHQSTAQAYGDAKFSENWKIADIKCVGSNTAGSVGLSLTQLGNSFLSNIKVHEFATNILCDRTTDNTYIKIRTITSSVLANSIGWEWRAGDTISVGGALQEYAYGIDVELLHTGCVGIKVDAANIHLNDVFYEKAITASAGKCFLWITDNCAGSFAHNGVRYALGNGTLDYLILTDNSTSQYQRGTFVDNVVMGNPSVTCSFGTSAVEWPWQFISPNDVLYTLLKPAIVAKKVATVGGRMSSIVRTPGACANRAATQSIPDDADTMITFDGEAWDNDNMITLGSHPTRITITTPGIYSVAANLGMVSSTVGSRSVRIILNGATIIAGNDLPPEPLVLVRGSAIAASTLRELVAGDYLEMQVFQKAGVALDATIARLAVQRISSMD